MIRSVASASPPGVLRGHGDGRRCRPHKRRRLATSPTFLCAQERTSRSVHSFETGPVAWRNGPRPPGKTFSVFLFISKGSTREKSIAPAWSCSCSLPQTSDTMDSSTARQLFAQGGILIILDMPENSDFGIDYNSWTTGPKFQGVKMIPPGVHMVHYAAVGSRSSQGQQAPRSSFFLEIQPKQVRSPSRPCS